MRSSVEIIKKFWLVLLIGLILRLILAASTFHLDVKAQMVASSGYFNGIWDIYHYARTIHPDTVLDKLPMSYFLDFPLRLPLHFLVDISKEKIFLLSPSKLFGDPWLFGYLIYAKMPFILADLLVGILLAKALNKQKQILTFWMFNPFTLWATTMIGQIDIYISLFILAAYLLLEKSKFFLAALILGLGIAVKSVPLLLLPLLWHLVSGWKNKILVIVLSFLPTVITVLPYLSSADFRHDALLAPQLTKMLYAQIPLSGGESVSINLVLILFLYIYFYSKRRSVDDFSKFAVVIFLVILSFTHFHLQWILWVMPLFIVWFLKNRGVDTSLALFAYTVGFVMMLFLFESSLQLKLFAPVFPSLDSAKGLWELLPSETESFLRSIAASIFAGGSLYLSFKILKD